MFNVSDFNINPYYIDASYQNLLRISSEYCSKVDQTHALLLVLLLISILLQNFFNKDLKGKNGFIYKNVRLKRLLDGLNLMFILLIIFQNL